MSQFDPSKGPFDYGSQQTAFDAEMMPVGPAPMSGMAVAGFVSSVIVCCPVLSPLLGLIFSLVGLAQTRGGLRRGRGLAIAGLIISLLGVPLQGLGALYAFNVFKVPLQAMAYVTTIFVEGPERAGPTIAALYHLCSDDFKAKVSQEEFQKWIGNHQMLLGPVQAVEPGGRPQQLPMGARFTLNLKSSSRTVPFTLEFKKAGQWKMTIADILIDDESALEKLGGL